VSGDALAAARVRCDPEVFTEVYCYFRAIYLYVAARLGTGPAEDIAAETFAVAFGQRDRFDPARGGVRPWLFGIATNLVARYRRAEARRYQEALNG
jgi:RNA polymerase sigma-70 factor (ECF subfamily)